MVLIASLYADLTPNEPLQVFACFCAATEACGGTSAQGTSGAWCTRTCGCVGVQLGRANSRSYRPPPANCCALCLVPSRFHTNLHEQRVDSQREEAHMTALCARCSCSNFERRFRFHACRILLLEHPRCAGQERVNDATERVWRLSEGTRCAL